MYTIIFLISPQQNCKCRRGGFITLLPVGIERSRLTEYKNRETSDFDIPYMHITLY